MFPSAFLYFMSVVLFCSHFYTFLSFHSPFPCHPSSEGILPFTNDQCNGKKEITSGIFIYKCDLNGQKETDFNFLKWNVFVMQEQVQGGK